MTPSLPFCLEVQTSICPKDLPSIAQPIGYLGGTAQDVMLYGMTQLAVAIANGELPDYPSQEVEARAMELVKSMKDYL